MTATEVPRVGVAGAATPEPHLVVVDGDRLRVSAAGLREVWDYREVLRAFTVRKIKVRYKQAAFGIGWAVLQPVITAVIFAIFIGHVARVGGEGLPYFVFTLTGMTVWTFFTTATTGGLNALVGDSGLLRKVYFPREVLPLSAVASSLVDLAPSLTALLAATMSFGIYPTLSWLLMPIPLLLVVLFATGVGIGLSAINVYYRDVGFIIPFVLQVGLFASPVIYSLQKIPLPYRGAYATINPVASAIDGLRRCLLHGQAPDWSQTGAAFLVALAVLFGSYAMFKRLERGFSDRV